MIIKDEHAMCLQEYIASLETRECKRDTSCGCCRRIYTSLFIEDVYSFIVRYVSSLRFLGSFRSCDLVRFGAFLFKSCMASQAKPYAFTVMGPSPKISLSMLHCTGSP